MTMSRVNGEQEEPPVHAPKHFVSVFCNAQGALPVLLISILFSVGVASTIGLIPDTLADRYARINHDYQGDHCSEYDRSQKPAACQDGSDEAQAAAAWANVAVSFFSLMGNPVIGSISDVRGRKVVLLASLLVYSVPPLVFCLLLKLPRMNPVWYYASMSLPGIVNYLSISFATLSDVIPQEYLTASYGLLLAGFYSGYSLAPSAPVFLSRWHVALLSPTLMLTALVLALFFLPETLSEEIREENRIIAQPQEAETEVAEETMDPLLQRMLHAMTRPIREAAILNRTWILRLVTAGSFFASMVFSSDTTLVVYYIEDELNVRQHDIAQMFLLLGIFGIVLQGACLQPLIGCLGEKGLLMTSFVSGTLHNLLYGLARGKATIYAALMLSQVTKLNLGILSSLASADASASEQGRIQGALFASNSIAMAVGPLSMEVVHHYTKNRRHYGPGFMFVYAAGLYAIGFILVSLIPVQNKPAAATEEEPTDVPEVHDVVDPGDGIRLEGGGDLEEPLLPAQEEVGDNDKS